MLSRDDELRLSSSTQAAYAKCGDDGDTKDKVTEHVQQQVCREFGFGNKSHVAEGLEVMRCAGSMFPNDAEVFNAAHYMRFNIIQPCPIQVGEVIPNVALHTPNGATTAHELIADASSAHLTLLIAGSYT